jgi:hypothetical protein
MGMVHGTSLTVLLWSKMERKSSRTMKPSRGLYTPWAMFARSWAIVPSTSKVGRSAASARKLSLSAGDMTLSINRPPCARCLITISHTSIDTGPQSM